MHPPSPAALEKLYRDGMWEERQRKADEATAAFDLEGLKEVATNALGHPVTPFIISPKVGIS